jgi:PAS domain S-box-containing protein
MDSEVDRDMSAAVQLLAHAAKLAGAASVPAVVEAAQTALRDLCGPDAVAIAEVRSGDAGLGLLATSGVAPDCACAMAEVITARRAAWLETAAEVAARCPLGARSPAATLVCVPLVAEGEPVGVVRLGFTTPRPFTAAERELLERLADLVAAALGRARRDEGERRALREHEALFREAPVGLALLDRDLRYARINARMAACSATTPSALLGRRIHDVWPAAAMSLDPALRRVLETGEPIEERAVSAAPGSPQGGVISVFAVRDVGGATLGLGVTSQPGTAQHTNQERLSMALTAARMVAWECDAETDRVVHTGDVREILGLNPDAEIGTTAQLAALVHPDDAALYEETRALAGRGESYRRTYRVIRPVDGGIVWIESAGRGVTDASGQVVRSHGVMMDVTTRVRAEQQRAAAELGSQLKDEFLARVSHELRTPLAAQRMWVQVLRSGVADDRRAAIDAIDKCSRAQSKLIEDLLDLARGMNGKLRITEEIFDVRAPIEEAVAVMRPEAEAKSVLLLTAMASDAGCVRGDPGRIQQVVVNLLNNAVKFTPAGGRVEVLARAEGGAIVLSVSDTGAGIDPGELEAVFIPFRQHEGGGPPTHSGLGLGLAIAKQLVDLHGGAIRADSRGEGHGAAFTVTLPRVPEEDVPPTPSQAHRARQAAVPLTGIKLLLVEDHGPTREGVARVLRTLGAEVTACACAAEGFAEIERSRPDVILSDLAMPDEDGFAFMRRVRAGSGEAARTPAVALTAHARPEDALRALSAGFQVHVAKPLDSQYLVDTIVRLLGRTPASSVPPPGRRHRRRGWSTP